MSRVDQALKRARQGSPGHSDEPLSFSLEDYPAERTTPSRHPEESRPEDAVLRMRSTNPPVATEHTVAQVPASTDARLRSVPKPQARTEAMATAPRHAGSPRPHPVAGSAELMRQCETTAAMLQDRQAKDGLKNIALMSAMPGEGRTTCAVNLAVTLNRIFAARVLLIDGDMCRPSLHDVLGTSAGPGLTDILDANRRDVLPIPVSPLLDLLPTGLARAAVPEVAAQPVKELISQMGQRYDWIIIDTPAMASSQTGERLGRAADGILFIVGEATPFPRVQQAMGKLGRPLIVATILNRRDASPST